MKARTNPVRVYADGGFNQHAKYGAWAFYVPLYGYEESGSAEGIDSRRFEMRAAIQGIKWVLANHASPAPIEVMTDCSFVLHWVTEARLRKAKKTNRTKIPVLNGDLLLDLEELLGKRPITAQRVSSMTDASHARCDHLCTGTLAMAIQANSILRDRVSAVYPRSHLDRLLFARKLLHERLDTINEAIARVKPPPLTQVEPESYWPLRLPYFLRGLSINGQTHPRIR